MSRNQICKAAIETGVEWLLFLDSDVVAPADTFARLSRHHMPIVQGVYHTKAKTPTGAHPPLVMRRIDQDGTKAFAPIQGWTPGDLVSVDTVATGLLLIHRRVLKAFQDAGVPWFEWTVGRRHKAREKLGLTDEDIKALDTLKASLPETLPGQRVIAKIARKIADDAQLEGLSEDFDFGWKAKGLGFPLYVDTSCTADHVTSALIRDGKLVGVETP